VDLVIVETRTVGQQRFREIQRVHRIRYVSKPRLTSATSGARAWPGRVPDRGSADWIVVANVDVEFRDPLFCGTWRLGMVGQSGVHRAYIWSTFLGAAAIANATGQQVSDAVLQARIQKLLSVELYELLGVVKNKAKHFGAPSAVAASSGNDQAPSRVAGFTRRTDRASSSVRDTSNARTLAFAFMFGEELIRRRDRTAIGLG